MQILFSLFIVVVLLIALVLRRRERKAWEAKERFEESGAWIEKRPSERGTFGPIDAANEAERYAISRKGRMNDAALDIRNYAFEHIAGFHQRSDEEIRAFTAAARSQITALFDLLDKWESGGDFPLPKTTPIESAHSNAIKKIILDALYEQYQWLLEEDIEPLRQLDRLALVSATLVLASLK